MGKRQEAALLTRKKLIIAAEKLISERGFENVTIQDIAAQAGVAVGTFYTYFKRKEDVVGEITQSNFSEMERRTIESNDNVYEKLTFFLSESMNYIAETGLKIAQQWFSSVVDRTEDGTIKLNYDLKVISDILRQGIASGELKADMPVDDIAFWIVSEYYGICTLWCMLDGSVDPTEKLRDFCKTRIRPMLSENAVR